MTNIKEGANKQVISSQADSLIEAEACDYVAILLEMYPLCPTLRNPATNE